MFGQSSGGGWTFRRYDKWLNHQGRKKIYHLYSCQHNGRWYSSTQDWKHGGASFYFGFRLSVIHGETAKHLTVFGHLLTLWQQPTGLKSKLWNRRGGGKQFWVEFHPSSRWRRQLFACGTTAIVPRGPGLCPSSLSSSFITGDCVFVSSSSSYHNKPGCCLAPLLHKATSSARSWHKILGHSSQVNTGLL